jgi:hypothetical protein
MPSGPCSVSLVSGFSQSMRRSWLTRNTRLVIKRGAHTNLEFGSVTLGVRTRERDTPCQSVLSGWLASSFGSCRFVAAPPLSHASRDMHVGPSFVSGGPHVMLVGPCCLRRQGPTRMTSEPRDPKESPTRMTRHVQQKKEGQTQTDTNRKISPPSSTRTDSSRHGTSLITTACLGGCCGGRCSKANLTENLIRNQFE